LELVQQDLGLSGDHVLVLIERNASGALWSTQSYQNYMVLIQPMVTPQGIFKQLW